jgi:lipoprotein-releasing system ATP-binding protein
MIEIKNIEKSYGTLNVLKGIDLIIGEGEIISIVGASGAGKSTLLHILGTLDNADKGEYSFKGEKINGYSEKKLSQFRNQHIGFVFQFHQLLPEFTALENVCMPALIGGKKLSDVKDRALELLRFLNVESRANHKPSELSGGEQQRVAVARALINNPEIIFADEPSGNLDSANAKELHQLFFRLRDEYKQSFVIVTHNEELANMADRKLVMQDGKILA